MPVLGTGVPRAQRWLVLLASKSFPQYLWFFPCSFLGLLASLPSMAAPQQPGAEGAVCRPCHQPRLHRLELGGRQEKQGGQRPGVFGKWAMGSPRSSHQGLGIQRKVSRSQGEGAGPPPDVLMSTHPASMCERSLQASPDQRLRRRRDEGGLPSHRVSRSSCEHREAAGTRAPLGGRKPRNETRSTGNQAGWAALTWPKESTTEIDF